MKKTITMNQDGSLNIKLEDTRTLEQKLTGELTIMEKYDLTRDKDTPTYEEITAGWAEYDSHKFYK